MADELEVKPTMDATGTLHLPAYALPESIYMSAEAKNAFIDLNSTLANMSPNDPDAVAKLMRGLVEQAEKIYRVKVTYQHIGGVPAHVVVPSDGIAGANRERILINLHGGGGSEPPPELNQLIEAIPVAAVSGIEVVSIDFRLDAFPHADQDIETVYRKLLRAHKARNIGVYGCSFGGILTAQSMAWFERQRLPLPGAIGIFCAGVDWPYGGDSAFYAWPFFGGNHSAPPYPNPPVYEDIPYFRYVNPKNPLVSPAVSSSVLSCFPPTLIVTGTRDFMLSSAVHAQNLLAAAGVQVDLRIWDGMWHAFFYSVNIPESKEMYSVTARFFDANLGVHRTLGRNSRVCIARG